MKQFFKTVAYGFAAIGMSLMSTLCIGFALYRLIIELPAATGFTAVGMFIHGLILLGLGGILLYGLGYAISNND